MTRKPRSGKSTCEPDLLRRLFQGVRPGDVMLADARQCNNFPIATLMAAGVDVSFE